MYTWLQSTFQSIMSRIIHSLVPACSALWTMSKMIGILDTNNDIFSSKLNWCEQLTLDCSGSQVLVYLGRELKEGMEEGKEEEGRKEEGRRG